jgi:hypothetical protein
VHTFAVSQLGKKSGLLRPRKAAKGLLHAPELDTSEARLLYVVMRCDIGDLGSDLGLATAITIAEDVQSDRESECPGGAALIDRLPHADESSAGLLNQVLPLIGGDPLASQESIEPTRERRPFLLERA